MPAQEQGLLNDHDHKIACSVVLLRNFRDRFPASFVKSISLSEESKNEVEAKFRKTIGIYKSTGAGSRWYMWKLIDLKEKRIESVILWPIGI